MTIAKGTIHVLTEKGSDNTPNKYSNLYPKTSADQIADLDTAIEEKVTSMISYDATKTSGDVIGTLTIDNTNHVLYSTPNTPATTSTNGLMSAADKTKLDDLTNYILPTASNTTKGGIKIGNGLSMDGDTLNVTIQSDSSGSGIGVLNTMPSAVEGAFWRDTINDVPVLKLRHGDYEYNFQYDDLTHISDNDTTVATVTPDTYVLGTTSVSSEGGIWYEVNDNVPKLKLHAGNYNYGFKYDSITYKGNNSHLVVYLPFDSAVTADACGNEWTAIGDISIDTTIKKLGTGSLKINDNGNYGLKVDSIIDINADKWTFDGWYYRDASNTAFHIGLENSHTYGQTGIITLYDGIYVPNATKTRSWSWTTNTFALGEWTHVAIVKNGLNLLFFKNGQLSEKLTLTGSFSTGGGFELGYAGDYSGHLAHYDSLRFFEDVALWTENFTPPTAEDYL